ncbi:MAG TPA: hypothetical protein DEQ14_03125, partial [Treponema sp.]|nr:hypothetical protein [Treponema sp.]
MKREIFAIRAGHFLPAICFLIFSACAKPPPEQREFALGTLCSVNLYEYGTRQLYSRIFARIREIERTMSARQGTLQIEPTDLMKINENAGIAPVKIPRDLFEVLERAKYYAQISGGAFDPTIGPLVNLWGIGTEQEKVPTPDEISDALSLVNWQDLILESGEQTAYLSRRGMALDLGAIAKGYAADEAARIACDSNAKRGIIDLGGNILAIGGRSQTGNTEAPWRIGVQNPLKKRGTYIGVLSLRDRSVVTSGIYERNFVFEGKVYHHILSVKDGYP